MIKKTYQINASAAKVWEALTNSKIIGDWGGGPAKMSEKEGFKFSLWGGDIFGTNLKSVNGKMLKQVWYGGKWDKPSTVTFDLKEKNGITSLKLSQTGVPMEDVSDIDSGWDDYYLGPLKQLLEK